MSPARVVDVVVAVCRFDMFMLCRKRMNAGRSTKDEINFKRKDVRPFFCLDLFLVLTMNLIAGNRSPVSEILLLVFSHRSCNNGISDGNR